MDTINADWLKQVDELADLYDDGHIGISSFTSDQLHYLIYWNWGVSGVYIPASVVAAEAELGRRNIPYNEEYAELINEKTLEV